MRSLLVIIFFCIAFSNGNCQSYALEESGNRFMVNQNPTANLRAAFINGKLPRGLKFTEGYELTDAKLKALSEKYFKSFPHSDFGQFSLLSNPKNKPEPNSVKWTFVKVLNGEKIEVWGQFIVRYSAIDKQTGYPLISTIQIIPRSEVGSVDEKLILKLHAEAVEYEKKNPLPPPPTN